jgi:hypothetical protein
VVFLTHFRFIIGLDSAGRAICPSTKIKCAIDTESKELKVKKNIKFMYIHRP